MKTGLLAVALLLGLGMPLAAQDRAPLSAEAGSVAPRPAGPAVVVRQSLEPTTGVVIGQHVALRVDVLFRDEMPRPPRVSLPDVPGMQVLRFETQATTMRETIDGSNYVGQRFELALYPRRGGTFEIPAASVVLRDRQGDSAGTAFGQPVPLEVRVPPGVDASGPVVATRRLTLSEQWEPGPKGTFKAGDAIVRTITRAAEDVPGLAMRDLTFPAPQGVRAYVDPPDVTDQSNRGIVTGRRMDRVTYVFERGGRFELPAVEQPWWDLRENTLRTARAPGVAIAVTAVAAASEAVSGGAWRRPAWIAAGIALLGALAYWVRRRRHAGMTSAARVERDAFTALRQACAATDARATYDAFACWRRVLDPARGRAAGAIQAPLDAALFGGAASTWNTEQSSGLLESAAKLRRARRPETAGEETLPPLNPGTFVMGDGPARNIPK